MSHSLTRCSRAKIPMEHLDIPPIRFWLRLGIYRTQIRPSEHDILAWYQVSDASRRDFWLAYIVDFGTVKESPELFSTVQYWRIKPFSIFATNHLVLVFIAIIAIKNYLFHLSLIFICYLRISRFGFSTIAKHVTLISAPHPRLALNWELQVTHVTPWL